MAKGGNFSRLPSAAVCDARVSPETLRVLAAFCMYADKDGICFPATVTVAHKIGLSRQGVQYHVRKLERLRYLTVWRRQRPDGMNQVNHYQVSYPDPASVPQAADADPAPQAQCLQGRKP